MMKKIFIFYMVALLTTINNCTFATESDQDGLAVTATVTDAPASPDNPRHYIVDDCDFPITLVDITFTKGDSVESITYNKKVLADNRILDFSIPRADIYTIEYTVTPKNGTASYKEKIEIERKFQFKDIVIQKGNLLFVNDNPLTNGGFQFDNYKWFCNDNRVRVGTKQDGGQYYFKGSSSLSIEPFAYNEMYRLELTTKPPRKIISTCEGSAKTNTNYETLRVYPNPAIDQLTVSSEQLSAGDKVEIYNLNGTLIKACDVASEAPTIINTSHLPTGIYVLKAGNQSATVVVK